MTHKNGASFPMARGKASKETAAAAPFGLGLLLCCAHDCPSPSSPPSEEEKVALPASCLPAQRTASPPSPLSATSPPQPRRCFVCLCGREGGRLRRGPLPSSKRYDLWSCSLRSGRLCVIAFDSPGFPAFRDVVWLLGFTRTPLRVVLCLFFV